MAPNSTPRRRFGVALGVILPVVTAGLIGFTGTASAHTPKWTASCDEKTGVTTVSVKLTAYNASKDNHVTVTDGATELVNKAFRAEFIQKFETSGSVDHVFKIDVKAHDGKQFNFKDELTVKKCVTPPTTTTTTTTTTESSEPSQPPTEPSEPTTTESSEAPTSSEAPPVATTAPTTTTTTAEVQEAALAETGASIALPLGIAGVLIVGGVVALFVVRRRSKA